MDLYEALKAGTSEEELLKAFHKDLNEASARIAAEQEEKNTKERLTTNRKNLAENLITYAETLLNEHLDKSISVDFIIKTLKEFEKETEQIVNLSKRLNKILEKPKNENDDNDDSVEIKVTAHVVNDDDIITNFLRELK